MTTVFAFILGVVLSFVAGYYLTKLISSKTFFDPYPWAAIVVTVIAGWFLGAIFGGYITWGCSLAAAVIGHIVQRK